MSKEDFKKFARNNPHLLDYVQEGKTTWQKLYEVYDLYGEKSTVWDKYKKLDADTNLRIDVTSNKDNTASSTTNIADSGNTGGAGLKDLLGLLKGIDLNTVQKGLSGLDKAIEAFKDFVPSGAGKATAEAASNMRSDYEPRPSYRYFED